MTDTRQALPPNGEPLNPEEWSAGYEQGFADARAALAAQPVAGAVATDETGWLIEHSGEILPGAEQRAQVSWLRVQMKFNGYGAREFGFTHDANEALRFARKEDAEAVLAMHLGASPPDWYSKPFSVTEHMWPLVPQPQAAPAPEPSAQAVAHPSHQTVREWMPVSEALRLSDLWTAGDLDNCGQWRAAIKVLADEVRALAASPQPEPSAQGEPPRFFDLLFELAQTGHISDLGITGEAMRQIRAALAASPQPEPSAQGKPVACDRDAPVCPWCDRQGWDICQHADDARTCGK